MALISKTIIKILEQELEKNRASVNTASPTFLRTLLCWMPNLKCVDEAEEALSGAKCAVIVTDHSAFRGLDVEYMKELMSHPCAIVDARNIINPKDALSQNIIFRGLGKHYFLQNCEIS